jgi:LysR family hydrogen peroxide-inducible transcriptional activator
MVDENNGATILPEFALNDLTKSQKDKVRYFKSPQPAREISIVTNKRFVKRRLIETLKAEILEFIPGHMKDKKKKKLI